MAQYLPSPLSFYVSRSDWDEVISSNLFQRSTKFKRALSIVPISMLLLLVDVFKSRLTFQAMENWSQPKFLSFGLTQCWHYGQDGSDPKVTENAINLISSNRGRLRGISWIDVPWNVKKSVWKIAIRLREKISFKFLFFNISLSFSPTHPLTLTLLVSLSQLSSLSLTLSLSLSLTHSLFLPHRSQCR